MVVRVWLPTALAVVLLAAGAALAARLAWPRGRIDASPTGLAAVSVPGYAGDVASVRATDPHGRALPVVLRHGTLWPRRRLDAGERLTVTVDVRRPGWIGWLVGRRVERTVPLVTPVAHLRARLLRPRPGDPVRVRFDRPVSRVAIGRDAPSDLGPARNAVPLGVTASGGTSAGATTVAAAARSWEKLSRPVRVSWFVAGPRAQVLATPAPGSHLLPGASLTLTFSQPVADVLGTQRPRVKPATPGHWRQLDAHTLSFTPSGLGFPFAETIHVRLAQRVLAGSRTTRDLAWHVRAGSTLRLQEILARLGYLPIRWEGATAPPRTGSAEVAAAVSPPQGRFSWRFSNTPAPLRALWKPGQWNLVTRAGVLRFEDEHGLATDGIPGRRVWHALLLDDLAGRRSTKGYSYVLVHETVPQSLDLWHDGRVIVTSPGNTGIPQAPTQPGTWPVFEHIPVGTMSGTNPDGSHYNDPGVRWISYFHGGDAIHAFPRPSYGTPQSLGCVELPEAEAARVWPYTPIGTLVTVEP